MSLRELKRSLRNAVDEYDKIDDLRAFNEDPAAEARLNRKWYESTLKLAKAQSKYNAGKEAAEERLDLMIPRAEDKESVSPAARKTWLGEDGAADGDAWKGDMEYRMAALEVVAVSKIAGVENKLDLLMQTVSNMAPKTAEGVFSSTQAAEQLMNERYGVFHQIDDVPDEYQHQLGEYPTSGIDYYDMQQDMWTYDPPELYHEDYVYQPPVVFKKPKNTEPDYGGEHVKGNIVLETTEVLKERAILMERLNLHNTPEGKFILREIWLRDCEDRGIDPCEDEDCEDEDDEERYTSGLLSNIEDLVAAHGYYGSAEEANHVKENYQVHSNGKQYQDGRSFSEPVAALATTLDGDDEDGFPSPIPPKYRTP